MRTVIVIRRRTEVVQVNGEFVDGQTIAPRFGGKKL